MRALLVALLAAGCASAPPRTPADVRAAALTTTPQKLCYTRYLALASGDKPYIALFEEIVRARGITCTPEMVLMEQHALDAAQARRDATSMEAFQLGQEIIRRSNPPVNPLPPPINCQSYTIDGRTYTTCR